MAGDKKVRVAIIGVGNCASALVQGVHYYRDAKLDDFVPGLMHVEGPSAYLMKSPPVQHPDSLAHEMTETFIREYAITDHLDEIKATRPSLDMSQIS